MAKKVPSEQMSLLELLLLGTPAAQSEPGSTLATAPPAGISAESILNGSVTDKTSNTSGLADASAMGADSLGPQHSAESETLAIARGLDSAPSEVEQIQSVLSAESVQSAEISLGDQTEASARNEQPQAQVEQVIPEESRRDLGAELLNRGAASDLGALSTEEMTQIKAVLSEAADLLLAGNASGDLYDLAVRVAVRHRPTGELLRWMGKTGMNRLSLLAAWPEGLPVTAQGRAASLYQEWVATRPDGAVAAIRPGYCRDRSGGLMPHAELACVAWMLPEERYVRTANIPLSRVADCKKEFLTLGLASSTESYPIGREAIGWLQQWTNGRAHREIFGSWRLDAAGRIVFFIDWHAKNYMVTRRPEFTTQMERLGYRCYAEDNRILMIPVNGLNGLVQTSS